MSRSALSVSAADSFFPERNTPTPRSFPISSYPGKPSQAISAIAAVALLTNVAERFIGVGGRQLLPGAKHPHAAFLSQRGCGSHRVQQHFFALGLQLKRVARLQVQFVAQGFRNYDAPGLVEC